MYNNVGGKTREDNVFNNSGFEIVPIFHPSEELCQIFANIDISCSMDTKRANALFRDLDKDYFDMWKKEKNVFTFVARYEKQIIGFTNGYIDTDNTMYLNGLYVEPTYHYCGIGSKLLKKAEFATSIIRPTLKLMPLKTAESFYQQYKYGWSADCHMVKKLPKPINGVVPVFEWCDELQAKLSFKVDNALLKSYKYQPMFVYVGKNNQIDGVAVGLPDGKQEIMLNEKLKSLAKYRRIELSYALDSCR